ncbi:hypothetical protein JQC67_10370 [Aurantibacter crassamenti]|uniref:SdrD B-like domain-containing protein n=1 Tax=Aurantibacter crassamenti TaxID=1837375 RepID=UPI00193A1779|nr:SdrD B-like domain-containing protein [Aurantibacter crassamenti]MBM1106543.1 hypothetical protein [Aurantibacter crassamenti]
MKNIFFLMALTLLLSCSKDNEGSIFGVASADNENQLTGITVKLYTEEAALISTTSTDAEGSFFFNGLESGNYYIGATTVIRDTIWDTGNTPQIVYVGDEIAKEVALTLNKKE